MDIRVIGLLAIATVLISAASLASPIGYWLEKKFNEKFNRH
jgi:hypothetical protein